MLCVLQPVCAAPPSYFPSAFTTPTAQCLEARRTCSHGCPCNWSASDREGRHTENVTRLGVTVALASIASIFCSDPCCLEEQLLHAVWTKHLALGSLVDNGDRWLLYNFNQELNIVFFSMSSVRVTMYALFLNTRGDKALVLQLKVVPEVRQASSFQGVGVVGGFPQSAPHGRQGV